MQFRLDDADEAFRQRIRSFIQAKLPPDIARRTRRGYHPIRADMDRWTKLLAEEGWVAPHWPLEYGGTGWTALQRHIFENEMVEADASPRSVHNVTLLGPVLYTFGTEAQKRRWLPPILAGDVMWCQGFSEPESGSDLASLKTRATREGDHYFVNGQKMWTSEGHHADHIFLLAKTDVEGKPQQGISFFLADMRTPGIEVRPVVTLDGGVSVNQVFLDNVRIPADQRVGEEGQGWTIAKFLLTQERASSAEIPSSKRDLKRLKAIAAHEHGPGGGRLIDDPIFRMRIAALEIDLTALEFSTLRVLSEADEQAPMNVASALKVRGSEMRQRLSELTLEALGDRGIAAYPNPESAYPQIEGRRPIDDALMPPGPAYAPGALATYLFRRATTIYGGSNEIQRTIIAKTILGL